VIREDLWAEGKEMATKRTKDDVRMLKTLAREKTKTTAIARKLKRSVAATYVKATESAIYSGVAKGYQKHSYFFFSA
jgi:hypothetical protein